MAEKVLDVAMESTSQEILEKVEHGSESGTFNVVRSKVRDAVNSNYNNHKVLELNGKGKFYWFGVFASAMCNSSKQFAKSSGSTVKVIVDGVVQLHCKLALESDCTYYNGGYIMADPRLVPLFSANSSTYTYRATPCGTVVSEYTMPPNGMNIFDFGNAELQTGSSYSNYVYHMNGYTVLNNYIPFESSVEIVVSTDYSGATIESRSLAFECGYTLED